MSLLLLGHVVAYASVAEAASDLTLQVTVGVQNVVVMGLPAPIHVSIRSPRPLRGTLRIIEQGPGAMFTERDIELAAGTTKDIWLVTPGSPFGDLSKTVQVRESNGETTEITVQSAGASGTDLVGVLPRLNAATDPPTNITFAGDLGTARIGVIAPEQLELGHGGIAMYSTIAAEANDLTGLSAAQRSALFAWIQQGGRLLVDDDDGGALPPQWLPGPTGYALAGRGEVRMTTGALAAGRWSEQLTPGPVRTGFNMGPASQFMMGFGGGATPFSTLVRDAGLRLNRLGNVLLILVVYLLLIGPVLFIVLRRLNRLTLGWIVIPVAALLTSGIVTVIGQRSRTSKSASHLTIIETNPAGGFARTTGLVVSTGSGRRGFRLPTGWLAGWDDTGAFSQLITQRATDAGSEATVNLSSGQAAIVNSFGSLATDAISDRLEVKARSDADGAAAGSVRNGGAEVLDDVAVFVGQAAVYIGRLEPGVEKPFTVSGGAERNDVPGSFQVWANDSNDVGFGGPVGIGDIRGPIPTFAVGGGGVVFEPAGPVFGPNGQGTSGPLPGSTPSASPSAWESDRLRTAVGSRFGTATAVGWRRGAAAPVRTLGNGQVTAGRIAISAIAVLEAGPKLSNITIRRELLATGNQFDNGPQSSAVVRFVLPPTARSVALTTTTPSWMQDLSVWDGSNWLTVSVDGDASDIPPGALRDGVVLAKYSVDLRNGFEPTQGEWTMQERS